MKHFWVMRGCFAIDRENETHDWKKYKKNTNVLYLLVVRWHTHFISCIMVPNTCSATKCLHQKSLMNIMFHELVVLFICTFYGISSIYLIARKSTFISLGVYLMLLIFLTNQKFTYFIMGNGQPWKGDFKMYL